MNRLEYINMFRYFIDSGINLQKSIFFVFAKVKDEIAICNLNKMKNNNHKKWNQFTESSEKKKTLITQFHYHHAFHLDSPQ